MAKELLGADQAGLEAQLDTQPSGIDLLLQYRRTGTGLNIDPDVYTTSQKVSPLVRGVSQEVEGSISSILEHTTFKWLQVERDSFVVAAERDEDLDFALIAIDELVNVLADAHGDLETEKRLLYSLALAEKLAEVSLLARPHLPRSVKRRIDEMEQMPEEQSLSTRTPKVLFPIPRLPAVPFLHVRIPNVGSAINRVIKDEPESFEEYQRRKRPRLQMNSLYQHPLLEQQTETGKERVMVRMGDQTMIQFNSEFIQDMICLGIHEDFVITHVFNSFDPATGVLATDAQPKVAEYVSSHNRGEISTPLGLVGSNTSFIGVPRPVGDVNQKRYYEYPWRGSMTRLGGVELTTEDNKLLLDGKTLEQYVREDGLGNYFIAIEEMPDELRGKLSGQQITMHTNFASDGRSQHEKESASWIGSMTGEEQYRLKLYPREIRRFIETLRQKKREQAERDPYYFNSLNPVIFTRLTQFLGNFWLTYDRADTPHSEDEPIDFQQTERVLASRRASCEGANIALGQLMRYLLDEGEGIAYVAGFVVNRTGRATAQDYHLKVLYRNRYGGLHFFDATPWTQEQKDQFSRATRQRREAVAEWVQTTSHLRSPSTIEQRKELAEQIKSATIRLERAWHPNIDINEVDLRQALRDRHVDRLPGRLSMDSVYYLLSEGPQENQARVRLPLKKEIKYSRSLVRFLQDFYSFDNSFSRWWWSPGAIIENNVDLYMKPLKQPLYGSTDSTHMDVNQYIAENSDQGRERLLKDHRLRSRLYTVMGTVAEKLAIASDQNMKAFENLADYIESLSSHYEGRFKELFAARQAELGRGIDTFLESAPFILVLPNPLNELRDFFTRSTQSGQEGFLQPYTEDEIQTLIQIRLKKWHESVEEKLAIFEQLITSAPRTRSTQTVQVAVPSIKLWKDVVAPREEGVKIEEPRLLDPFDTFVYLYQSTQPTDNKR